MIDVPLQILCIVLWALCFNWLWRTSPRCVYQEHSARTSWRDKAKAAYSKVVSNIRDAPVNRVNLVRCGWQCSYCCGGSKVLFFPDDALPCKSFCDGLMNLQAWPCYNRPNCTYKHDSSQGTSSLMSLLNILNNMAERQVDLCMYRITLAELADFLIYLSRKRHVRVRIITDSGANEEDGIQNDQVPKLEACGIVVKKNVQVAGERNALMHKKFAIIDNETLISGSFNWTRNAVLRNRESVMITRQQKIIDKFRNKFADMWGEHSSVNRVNNGQCSRRCYCCFSQEALFFPDEALPCKSFYNRLMNKRLKRCRHDYCKFKHDSSSLIRLFKVLNEAQRKVDLCMYRITLAELADFLIHLKQNKHVYVRIITDSGANEEDGIQNDQIPKLKASGIEVKKNSRVTSEKNALMHNKFAIIDDKKLISDAVSEFRNEFAKMWKEY